MKYFRVATMNTPEVELDLENGYLRLFGKSQSTNSTSFYYSIINTIKHEAVGLPQIKADICLDHFNTSSLESLFKLFGELKKLKVNGTSVHVNWFYFEYDLEMHEMGMNFSDLWDLDFQLIDQPRKICCA